jgi:hypothetical protein
LQEDGKVLAGKHCKKNRRKFLQQDRQDFSRGEKPAKVLARGQARFEPGKNCKKNRRKFLQEGWQGLAARSCKQISTKILQSLLGLAGQNVQDNPPKNLATGRQAFGATGCATKVR